MSRTWHAVHTKPRLEWLVDDLLRQQGYETLYLHYPDTIRHARRVVQVQRAYFPRYLFVAVANGQSFYDINHTIGVSTVIYAAGEPLEVPPEVIGELRERGDKEGLVELAPEEKKQRLRYRPGEMVRVNDGPLMGFLGAVSLDNGRQVHVWMEMFKGRVNVGFAPEQLSPARRSLSKRAS